ncbi:nicotinate (nicotinamide) nucleotide adenylyltransferase [Fusobacterium sp.]|uniref:nicotinate (nicotinamide) nucleotide adenylyltransferase n=1 Tax=Fusobacterium sp. TaxID=68766 RepID=UPI002629CC5C|nr:nicotinate (nicotinamide) nucleotide adenylyltransferase [Fusobacterium sp.]
MRIGIYGGSFDPPHFGHKNVAQYAIENLKLDKLLIIPVGRASHGKNNLSDNILRYEMCNLVFGDIEKVEISKIEIEKNEISYTYKTLDNLMEIYGRENEYFEIIGGDSAAYFTKWKNYKEILENSTVVILRRKGYVSEIKSDKIIEFENDYYDISSTEIKQKLKNDEDCSDILDLKLIKFIKENGIYKKGDS